MKILVVSDSHYFNEYLAEVVQLYKDKVDLMIHCGDSSLPINDSLLENFQIIVKGNHDDDLFPIYKAFSNILVTHGHMYNVYYGYDQLIELCRKENCLFCFHGHTHVPTHQYISGIHFINPGSLMMNRGSYGYGTYAIVEINNENIRVDYYNHQTHKKCDQRQLLNEGKDLLEEFKQILSIK